MVEQIQGYLDLLQSMAAPYTMAAIMKDTVVAFYRLQNFQRQLSKKSSTANPTSSG
jgi:hypothetical protein